MRCLVVLIICMIETTTQEQANKYWSSLKLHEEHLVYFFRNNKNIKQQCLDCDLCPYKEDASAADRCWGYEQNCPAQSRMKNPFCEESLASRWAKSKDGQIDTFWRAADFGYVKDRRGELKMMCEPEEKDDSSLQCASFARYCRATNLYIDFRRHPQFNVNNRYREDMFKAGEIGGHCKLHKEKLKAEGEHKSALQSWFAELESYSSLDFKPIEDKQCDVIIEKPTYLIKLDAGVNFYHHFCDFVNLYTSQHVNNSFDTDVFIINWDTSPMNYGDFFHDTWKAFSDHPVIYLREYAGKRVCFKEAVFSLLARMRYGMYYNMPLIPGCSGSSLFRAFSQHVLHRLNVTQEGPLKEKIRITLLARSTQHRNIINQNELVGAMKSVGEFEVQMVDFTRAQQFAFLDQLQIMHNTDIFIGMHGAGLTHMLFQPDWGVVFEIYNCEDAGCYSDLARLRGLKYMTWEKKEKLLQEDEGHHPTLGAHAKFTNYGFNVHEFMRMIYEAADYVRSHKDFIEARKKRYSVQEGHSQNVKDEL